MIYKSQEKHGSWPDPTTLQSCECNSNVEARLTDDPDAETIFVAINRVRPCYPEQTDTVEESKNENLEQFLSQPRTKSKVSSNQALLAQRCNLLNDLSSVSKD